MMALISKGGILAIPILFCSVVAAAIFFERLIRFFRLGRDFSGTTATVIDHMAAGEQAAALNLTRPRSEPEARILTSALEVMDKDRETIETVLTHAVDLELRILSKYLDTLATIGNIAPLLGLLGTVIGMIKAFMVIEATGGKVNASVLAGGIWEAMLTTALGLTVAVPVVMAHGYLSSRVDSNEARFQSLAVAVTRALGRPAKKEV